MTRIPLALLATTALSATAAGEALAQASPGTNLEEIVVTAQRRSESLQDTALAIAALTGETLVESGIHTARDLQSQIPALQVAPNIFGSLQMFLRGVGSSNNSITGDPAVPIHIDGAYIPRTSSSTGLLYDIDRIEVVKGPQGTLYGRNATGGSVNIITRKPGFDLAGGGSLDVGNYGARRIGGYVNVPLSDNVALRTAFQAARHDPYMRVAPVSAGPVGNARQDQDDTAGRLHLLAKPTERLSILLTTDYAHQGGAGLGDQINPSRTGKPYVVRATRQVLLDNRFTNQQAQLDYDLGPGTLTYVGSYRDTDTRRDSEFPYTNYPAFYTERDHSQSHEIRFGGTTGSLIWVGGYYRFEEFAYTGFRAQVRPTAYLNQITRVAADSNAIFGQATYSIMPRLRLTAGARYTRDFKARRPSVTYNEDLAGHVVRTTQGFTPHATWSDTNWKVGVERDIADNSLGYFNISTAYKAGGFYGGATCGATCTFDPENLLAYEVGLKNTFLDGRMILNLGAYLYDYTDLQVSGLSVVNGISITVTSNAATATIKGAEIEAAYATGRSGKLRMSAAYTDARYDKFVLPFGDAYTNFGLVGTRPAVFSGQSMPLSPEWSATLGYEHSWNFRLGKITANAQTHYETEKYLDFHHFSPSYQRSYYKTDLGLSYEPGNSRWKVAAYIRNLENEVVLASATTATAAPPSVAQVIYAPPRLYGLQVSADF